MRTRPFLLALFSLALLGLQSCGGMETIVSVYPDGSSQLTYAIEAPTGQMPDLAAMGKGDLAEIFSKDQFLRQEPQKLIDSLVNFAVHPFLLRLKQSGRIVDYSVTDSNEFTQKKVKINLKLRSYTDVGPIHSQFKREIPALDSISRKLTNRPANAKNDSIAIVDLGEDLELQLYHFMPEPVPVDISRTHSIAKARHMMDSVLALITDSSSIFSAMMGEGEIEKLRDSMAILSSTLTDSQLDSMGRQFAMMENFGGIGSGELFKPKITLRAPLMLTNNIEEVNGRISVTPKGGAMQFEPSTPYGEIEAPLLPFRQRFSLKMPATHATTQDERDTWRGILNWCEECESAFQNNPSKQIKEMITFYPIGGQQMLIEVDCGRFNGEKAKMFFAKTDIDGMPTYAVHQFSQSFYLDDPVSEMRGGQPKFVTNKTDLIVGKVTYDKNQRTITIDRGSAKETFDMSQSAPQYRYGSYKDKAGKWIKFEGYVANASELFGSGSCADGVLNSSELPQTQR